MFVVSLSANVCAKKRTHKAKHRTASVVKKSKEAANVEEIDNYDFLYGDADEGYDYDAATMGSLMNEAFSHIGTPYRSGQSSPSGFDCSGFTSYVYGKLGISLGRSSRDQYTQGLPMAKSGLKSGDLVFFTSPSSGRSVGHVGIVTDVDNVSGNFNFIHASVKGVKVSSSSEPYYNRRYIGARRILE